MPFAGLQETRIRDRPVITICRGDAGEKKVAGCAIAVRNAYNNLVEEFGSTSYRWAFARLRDRKLWIASPYTPAESAAATKGVFYEEVNALMSKIPSQRVVIAGNDENAKIEHQSDVRRKQYYALDSTSDK
ncbi:hypothetical protein RB195_005021 [Necator americanus]